MFNRIKTNKGVARALGFALLCAPLASVQAVGIGTDLQTAATDAISALLVTVGVVLVAAFAIPVAKKTYRIIAGALGSAS